MATNDFIEKNKFRKYPVRPPFTDDLNREIPDDLILDISVTVPPGYQNVFVRQAVLVETEISIMLSAKTGSDEFPIGYFRTILRRNNHTEVSMTPFVAGAAGVIIFGNNNSLTPEISGVYNFVAEKAQIENSKVMVYSTPSVTSVKIKGNELTGNLSFNVLANVELTVRGNSLNFLATNPNNIQSLADQASFFDNCPTPIIRSINGVTPIPPSGSTSNDENIYLIGITPFNIGVVPGGLGALEITTATELETITLNTLCTQKNYVLPPVDFLYSSDTDYLLDDGNTPVSVDTPQNTPSNTPYTDVYYTRSANPAVEALGGDGNLLTAVYPEFINWPQFTV